MRASLCCLLLAIVLPRAQLLRPYPQFTSIQAIQTNGKSDYHAFQGRLERQMANGFTAQVAYTWSRLMTETNYLNNFDTELERVIGAFDRTHIFVVSGLAELPFGRGRRWGATWNGVTNALLGGWQISAIYKAQSGAPLGFGRKPPSQVRAGNSHRAATASLRSPSPNFSSSWRSSPG